MKNKAILWCIAVGIIVPFVWWWQRTRFESAHSSKQSANAGKTSAPRSVPAAELPSTTKSSQVIKILAERTEIPSLATLAKLTVDDEPALLSAYRSETNMHERMGLVWSLAYIGGDASLAAFQHTLTEEFAGQDLTGGRDRVPTEKELFMINLVWAIGVMAQKNDKAFDLLKRGTDPWFWQKNVTWKSVFNEDIYGMLTVRSMQSIGISGRRMVPEIFENLSKQSLINEPDPIPLKRTMNGGVVDGAFYYSIFREEGRDGFLQWFFTPKTDVFDEDGKFARWCATDDGKKWRQWSDEFDKASLIKQRERLKQAFPK